VRPCPGPMHAQNCWATWMTAAKRARIPLALCQRNRRTACVGLPGRAALCGAAAVQPASCAGTRRATAHVPGTAGGINHKVSIPGSVKSPLLRESDNAKARRDIYSSIWFPQEDDSVRTSACYQDANGNHCLMDKICGEPAFLHSARFRLHCPGRALRIHFLPVG